MMNFIVLICLFTTVITMEVLYSKIKLPNAVPMEYSDCVHNVSAIICGQLCTSTLGCERFHYDFKSCYILNDIGIASLNVSTYFGADVWADNCNNTEYPLYGGRFCMKIFHVQKSWFDANTTCSQNGGQLLTMKSEDYFMKEMVLKDKLIPDFFNGPYWIGGNDLDTPGDWKWSDGSAVDRRTDIWYPNQPDNYTGDEHCLQLFQLKMNDERCTTPRKFICEKLKL